MHFKTILLAGVAAALLGACGGNNGGDTSTSLASGETTEAQAVSSEAKLESVLAAQDEATKARYPYRHPKETLMFFDIEPGMRVAEALPGGGWYTKILLPYLGEEGEVIGVDYSLDMWPEFGGFADEAFLENKKTWPATWTETANGWRIDEDASVDAFAFGNRDTELDGTVDAVLFIRALHNLARFEDEGGYLTQALADSYALLKPGGIVGVVQHQAREDMPDDWADGNNGYLKKSDLIEIMEAAGFELVEESDINENPQDIPTDEEGVWRLPPTLGVSADQPELRSEMEAIGESNRMTLKFKKV
ncbi:class I SAM-dependent methyltransferase [Litorimonas sp.]|uniref:class I SAM-dependent methyltransferase n=1 Tax=Litorimonas sp. TaxID=1892381 RepID=UPI003A8859AF